MAPPTAGELELAQRICSFAKSNKLRQHALVYIASKLPAIETAGLQVCRRSDGTARQVQM